MLGPSVRYTASNRGDCMITISRTFDDVDDDDFKRVCNREKTFAVGIALPSATDFDECSLLSSQPFLSPDPFNGNCHECPPLLLWEKER